MTQVVRMAIAGARRPSVFVTGRTSKVVFRVPLRALSTRQTPASQPAPSSESAPDEAPAREPSAALSLEQQRFLERKLSEAVAATLKAEPRPEDPIEFTMMRFQELVAEGPRQESFITPTVGAAVGAGTLGAGAGTVGAIAGGSCGLLLAPFTFGLSVPLGAAVGGGVGIFGGLLGGALAGRSLVTRSQEMLRRHMAEGKRKSAEKTSE
eukprot:TRINITY_DN110908_c0_g1_i1.p2 TRINITY_DN110908_c0_g1~~TRINITY_DN110908_c0_g1_i1.p2  ORF type:complete len:209 (+),score=35.05 TRINITY_DN110908_c0_g1_i1:3-629(+)